MKIKKEPEEVTRIRKLLHHWDDGLITLGEFEMMVNRPFKDTLFDLMKEGKDYGETMAGSWGTDIVLSEDGLSFVPADSKKAIKINVELEIFPGGFWMRPIK